MQTTCVEYGRAANTLIPLLASTKNFCFMNDFSVMRSSDFLP